MKRMVCVLSALFCLTAASFCAAQTVDGYDTDNKNTGKSLLDPSRFTFHHMVSFGMSSSSQSSGLKSQGLYTTMMTYQISRPLTLDLNFSLPLFSSYNSSQNLNMQNLQSLDYFKNMPWDATLTWQPRENFAVQLSISKNYYMYPYYDSPFYSPFGYYNSPLKRHEDWK